MTKKRENPPEAPAVQRRQAEGLPPETPQDIESMPVEMVREVVRDLQARLVEMEKENEGLRHSESLCRTTVDAMSAAAHVVGPDLRITMSNKAYTRWRKDLGLETEVVGRTVMEVCPFQADVILDGYRRVFDTGEALVAEQTTTVGDRQFVVEVRRTPIMEEGRVARVVTVIRDITERRRAEVTLRKEGDRAQQYLDIAGVIFVAINNEGEVTLINQKGCEVLGYTEKEITGENWFDRFVPQKRRKVVRTLFSQLMAGEVEVTEFYENPLLTRSGEERIIAWHNTVLHDEAGNIAGTLSSGEDITERRRAEELAHQRLTELAHLSRLSTMGEMATTLAHELNQPLGAIANFAGGCASRLRSGTGNRQELLSALEQIEAAASRAGETIRRTRQFIGRREPKRSTLDISDLVRQVIELVQFEARRNDIRLQLDLADPAPPVYGDHVLVQQVVLNLLKNAIEAIVEAKTADRAVTVQTRAAPTGHLELTVRDSGPGIAGDLKERVFEPYYTTKEDGMGMGLLICRSIIAAHGGRLWVAPNPGRGATFRFTLPLGNKNEGEVEQCASD